MDIHAAGLLLAAPVANEVRVLLARRSSTKSYARTWTIPAGTMEPGEIPVGCAIREAREEIGDLPPFTVATVVGDGRPNGFVFHTVIALTDRVVPVIADGPDRGEVAELRWVSPEAGMMLDLHPGMRRVWGRVTDRAVRMVRRRTLLVA